jgi:hypothetical protein
MRDHAETMKECRRQSRREPREGQEYRGHYGSRLRRHTREIEMGNDGFRVVLDRRGSLFYWSFTELARPRLNSGIE